MTSLPELLKRVEAASGPDRELDAAVEVALDQQTADGRARARYYSGYRDDELPPPLTASIDAALALVEMVLPGWFWNIGQFPNIRAQLAQPTVTEFGNAIGHRADETAGTIPLAILAALLKAKIAETGSIVAGSAP